MTFCFKIAANLECRLFVELFHYAHSMIPACCRRFPFVSKALAAMTQRGSSLERFTSSFFRDFNFGKIEFMSEAEHCFCRGAFTFLLYVLIILGIITLVSVILDWVKK